MLEASGLPINQIVEASGYSYGRIWALRKDPAYQMLVAEKRVKIEEKEIEIIADHMQQKLLIMAAADRHIYDQITELDEAGELLPIKQALAISADMADRVGYGKHTTQTHHDGDFAARMEATLMRSGKKAEPIDATWLAEPKAIETRVVEFQPPQAVSAGALSTRSGSESPSPAKLLPQPFKRRF